MEVGMMKAFLEKKKIWSVFFSLLAGAIMYLAWHAAFHPRQQIDFNAQIRPILNNKCISCHGGVKQSGGFSLLFREEALRPNESGKPAIVPGKPGESELINRIKHHDPEFRMPLENEPLSEEEIGLLTKWIEQGAEWELHWAFKKLEPVELPSIASLWINNEIDKFVLQNLEENNLRPSPQADKSTLLRRVSLDLIGLPPTREEIRDFLNDDSPEAFGKVVDRLLTSPHYGERWTSMWMDLARYADSKGYTRDTYRSVWKYRDWLINSFNNDKPYNEFITEQLAGDLLPDPTDEQLIATAFHRNTLSNDEGGTDDEEFRVASVIDRVNTTWNALQATTMECVQCHSHPYDPIRHEDFYKSYGLFNNTADEDTGVDSPNLLSFTSKESKQQLEVIKNWVIKNTPETNNKSEKVTEFVSLIKLTEPKIHSHSFDAIKNGALIAYQRLVVDHGGQARLKNVPLHNANQMLVNYKARRSTGKVEIRKGSPNGELLGTWNVKNNMHKPGFETVGIPIKPITGVHDLYFIVKDPGMKGTVCTIEWVLFHQSLPGETQPGYQKVRENFFRLINDTEAIETPVMIELKGDFRRKTYVFERGNWMVHGEEVDPGVPEAWNDMPEGAPANRLGLAQWLTHKDNPLTARVMVNRLWAQIFGIGIVETQEDFGSQGSPPSHQQLLDWLAQQFMNDNWSIKKVLKLIVMSATYQQSSKSTHELLEMDPKNQLLARGPRFRLTAEQTRDQILAVSGLLSNKMYGPSVKPVQPEGIWDGAIGDLRWETSKGEDRYRRSLYTYWRRSRPYPSMTAFDTPSREFCVTRRINTNTPLQALVTLNDPVLIEAASALAERMVEGAGKNEVKAQISEGYRLAMVREIDPNKLHELVVLYEEAIQHFKDHPETAEAFSGKNDIPLAALTVVANVIMNLDEFSNKS